MSNPEMVRRRRANPFDGFLFALSRLLEEQMIRRMSDNDRIVSRSMDDMWFEEDAANQ